MNWLTTMTTEHVASKLEVPLASLAELAVDWWRLDRWLSALPAEAPVSHVRHAARRLHRFLSEQEVAVRDLTGQAYEPGLAVEVLDALEDASMTDERVMIDEMVAPVVFWRGTVVRHGQVVIRRRV